MLNNSDRLQPIKSLTKLMKKLILLLIIFTINHSFSQIINGTIISSEDNSPIQYAKIGFDNIEKGTFSDEKGNFSIDLSNIDSNSILKIEIAGFETYKISVMNLKQTNSSKIILNPKITEIQEVSILNKKYIEKNLGFTSKSKKIHLDYLPRNSPTALKKYSKEELDKPQVEIAVPIQAKSKSKIIKININFAKFNISTPIPARFIIYSELDGKPDKIINSEDIIFLVNNENIKENVLSLNISDKNIWFKDKIFVSFQPLDRNFSGNFWLSAGLLGNTFIRSYVENWKKLPGGIVPAINIDVKSEK